MNEQESVKPAMDERTMGLDESVLVKSCRRERPAVHALGMVGIGGQRHAVLPRRGTVVVALEHRLTRLLGLPQKPS